MAGKPYFYRREDAEDFSQELFFKRPEQNNYHFYVDFLRKHLTSKDLYKKGHITKPASHWLDAVYNKQEYTDTRDYMDNRIDIQRAIDKCFRKGRERAILYLLWYGFKHAEIGQMFGVNESRITQIVNGIIKPALNKNLRGILDPKP